MTQVRRHALISFRHEARLPAMLPLAIPAMHTPFLLVVVLPFSVRFLFPVFTVQFRGFDGTTLRCREAAITQIVRVTDIDAKEKKKWNTSPLALLVPARLNRDSSIPHRNDRRFSVVPASPVNMLNSIKTPVVSPILVRQMLARLFKGMEFACLCIRASYLLHGELIVSLKC